MKKKERPDIITLEKMVAEKYGDEIVQNVMKAWTKEKEQEFQEQLKKVQYKHYREASETEDIEKNGFLIDKKLLSRRDNTRECPLCDKYSFSTKDDLYFEKYGCCEVCYIKNYEWSEKHNETGKRGTSKHPKGGGE